MRRRRKKRRKRGFGVTNDQESEDDVVWVCVDGLGIVIFESSLFVVGSMWNCG